MYVFSTILFNSFGALRGRVVNIYISINGLFKAIQAHSVFFQILSASTHCPIPKPLSRF